MQTVSFPSLGEVIQPGEAIFELLPHASELVVEVRIPDTEIGHVAFDEDVSVTFDSFDVRRFGKVTGRLTSLSPVPLQDEITGEYYFRGVIELSTAYFGQGLSQRSISAGMTVVTEMVTGEKSLLEYILRPVERTLSTSFSER